MKRFLLCLFLAGCASTPTVWDTTADADTGALRGSVVDEESNPIEGALVSIPGQHTTTDATGKFAFSDLYPGATLLIITAEGLSKTQLIVEVVPGVARPDPIEVVLSPLGTTEYVVPIEFDGIINCAFRGFVTLRNCVAVDVVIAEEATLRHYVDAGDLQWLQTEGSWLANDMRSVDLCFDHQQLDVVPQARTCGPSPVVQTIDGYGADGDGYLDGKEFSMYALPAPLIDGGANIVNDQAFHISARIFYGFMPPAGWNIGDDYST